MPSDDDERNVIRTFASQIALALEGVRLTAEAEDARVEADLSKARAALFSSVSHDLRTPLASITASVTSLLGTDAKFGPRDRQELLETIRQEAERLNRLVGNFLHLSRLRAGPLLLETSPAAVDELIEAVVARMKPLLSKHRLRLVLRDNLPEVAVDVLQMDQALTNVLENAARAAPAGSEIAIFAARWENTVQVRVTDHGPGIPPELRERVFEPFFRINGEGGSGTGLGLAISRAIVEAHGGRIRIDGAPSGGTTVTIQLPAQPPR